MKQIQAIVDGIKKIEFIVKIAKAVLVGFDAFNAELQKSVTDGKE